MLIAVNNQFQLRNSMSVSESIETMKQTDLDDEEHDKKSTFAIVWFDDCNVQSEQKFETDWMLLEGVVDDVICFTVIDECIDFITDVEEKNIIFIAPYKLLKTLINYIYSIRNLRHIYAITKQKEQEVSWINAWPKIRGVETSIAAICDDIKRNMKASNENLISISYLMSRDITNINVDRLEPSFMYTQIFKEIILSIDYDQESYKTFANFCRGKLAKTLRTTEEIEAFERTYSPDQAIYWYTCESFLYRMVNQALRLLETDVIIHTGFFLADLHRQIEILHRVQHHSDGDKPLTVYRGQTLCQNDLDKLRGSIGHVISFNSFLSTSLSDALPMILAESYAESPDLYGIIFVIRIDPTVESVPFANITTRSYYNEDEVLFSMGSVFRIEGLENTPHHSRMFQANLSLSTIDVSQHRALSKSILDNIYSPDARETTAKLLLHLHQPLLVQKLFAALPASTENSTTTNSNWVNILGNSSIIEGNYQSALNCVQQLDQLDQANDENTTKSAHSYNSIGKILTYTGKYANAVSFYEKAIHIREKMLHRDDPSLAEYYRNASTTYDHLGDYLKALFFGKKALDIESKSLPGEHPSIAQSHDNMGTIYRHLGEYPKALSAFKKAVEIRQQSLPENHPLLADSFTNLGIVFNQLGDYTTALSFYEKALQILYKSLPENHPSVAECFTEISSLYSNLGSYAKALSKANEALSIQQTSLPPDHPLIANTYSNIGIVYNQMAEYSKALTNHLRSLEIRQKHLPEYHPLLIESYNNIGMTYDYMGDYLNAQPFFERVIDIAGKNLSTNHPSLAKYYRNVATLYNHLGEYQKALVICQKAIDIDSKILPENHPSIADSYNNIGTIYNHLGEYLKGLSAHQRAIDVRKKCLPEYHPSLAESYNNIAVVYKNRGEYAEALTMHQIGLDILQKSLPDHHPSVAECYSNIGTIYNYTNEYSKALAFYEQAIVIGEKALPTSHPSLAGYYRNMATVYNFMGEYTKALGFCQKAMAIDSKSLSIDHPSLGDSYTCIGIPGQRIRAYDLT